MITTGTEKQIAFAAKIRAALIKLVVETKMVPSDKIDGFTAVLDANSPSDAAKWIEIAKSLNNTGQIICERGMLRGNARKFLSAITAK